MMKWVRVLQGQIMIGKKHRDKGETIEMEEGAELDILTSEELVEIVGEK